MPKYKVVENGWVVDVNNTNRRVIRTVMNSGGSYFLGCCGIVGLESFNSLYETQDWNDKAEILACLYKELYRNGTVIYAITNQQLRTPMHLLLLEIGAQEIAVFPNVAHGPRMIHMFKVVIRNACGRYCNKYGEAYAEPPKDDSEIIPEQTNAQPAGWQMLPTR